jgi:hypothetical protein
MTPDPCVKRTTSIRISLIGNFSRSVGRNVCAGSRQEDSVVIAHRMSIDVSRDRSLSGLLPQTVNYATAKCHLLPVRDRRVQTPRGEFSALFPTRQEVLIEPLLPQEALCC